MVGPDIYIPKGFVPQRQRDGSVLMIPDHFPLAVTQKALWAAVQASQAMNQTVLSPKTPVDGTTVYKIGGKK